MNQSWLGPERAGERAGLLPAELASLVNEEEKEIMLPQSRRPADEAVRKPTNLALSHAVCDNHVCDWSCV